MAAKKKAKPTKKMVNVRMDITLKSELDKYAAREERGASYIVSKALRLLFAQKTASSEVV